VNEARKSGIPKHAVVTWVRRKAGGNIVVWRQQKDGSLGCATPCLLCSRELARFDMRVHCSQGGDSWYSGRLTDECAPEAKPTAGQIRTIFRPQRINQEQKQRVKSSKHQTQMQMQAASWL
jgi:hypothetical protein